MKWNPALLFVLMSPFCSLLGQDTTTLPNIVIVFADDMGYGDTGLTGAEGFKTPNMDRIASEGVRFTDFYVSQPVCSASRASLLTGCYANRLGISGALMPNGRKGLASEETTLAELVKQKGYRSAVYGKWHLGHLKPHLPIHHGFDEYYGIPYSNDMGPYRPDGGKWADLPTFEGDQIIGYNTNQAHFTRDMTKRAIGFIRKAHKEGAPFFVYVPHPMPHTPIYCSAEFRNSCEQGLYGDVIQEIDAGLGRIMATLEELQIAEDTLLIFTSDNGPWLSYGNHAGSSGPLREGKGTTFEGGVRVPCVMRWPKRIRPGHVCTEPAMTIDLLPTIAELIDGDLPDHPIDGKSIWPLIAGEPGAKSSQEAYYFWYGKNNLEAMRCGRWKLHFPHSYRRVTEKTPGKDGFPGAYDWKARIGLELFDLRADIGETKNVAADHPEVMRRLNGMADRMRARLGDGLQKIKGSEVRDPLVLPK